MAKRHARAMVVGVTMIALTGAAVVFGLFENASGQRGAGAPKRQTKGTPKQISEKTPKRTPSKFRAAGSNHVFVGGVKRKASDVVRTPRERPKRDVRQDPVARAGRTKPVRSDANPHVASVARALKEKKFPERLSAFARPKNFDRAAYKRNRKEYLETIEPGRVFQPAQPGRDVVPIKSIGSSRHSAVQGEWVTLRARAVPGAPVTFTSFDLGAFENQLPSITVEANRGGVAEAKFKGTPGTINNVNILAASPVTSGRLRYIVRVLPPPEDPNNEEQRG